MNNTGISEYKSNGLYSLTVWEVLHLTNIRDGSTHLSHIYFLYINF